MSRLFVPTERKPDPTYFQSVLQDWDAGDSESDFELPPTKVHRTWLDEGVFTIPPIKIKKNPESNWDETTWPDESRVLRSSGTGTINKTNAMKKYYLNDDDMKDLCWIDGDKLNPNYRPPKLYLEEEVLRRGWEKHGGPKGLKYAKAEQRRKKAERRNLKQGKTQATVQETKAVSKAQSKV